MQKCKELTHDQQFVSNKVKGQISKRVFHENKARRIFRKTNISNALIRTRMCAYQEAKNVKFDVLCFLETPVLRLALLPYYRRVNQLKTKCSEIIIITT